MELNYLNIFRPLFNIMTAVVPNMVLMRLKNLQISILNTEQVFRYKNIFKKKITNDIF